MSNRTAPGQLIGGIIRGTNGGAVGATALTWGTVKAVSAPNATIGALTRVQAPTNT